MAKSVAVKISAILLVALIFAGGLAAMFLFAKNRSPAAPTLPVADYVTFFDADGRSIKPTVQNSAYFDAVKKQLPAGLPKGARVYLSLDSSLQSKIIESGAQSAAVLDSQDGAVLAYFFNGANDKIETDIEDKIKQYAPLIDSGKLNLNSIIKTKNGDMLLKDYLAAGSKFSAGGNENVSVSLLYAVQAASAVGGSGKLAPPKFIKKIEHKGKILQEAKDESVKLFGDDTAYLLFSAIGKNYTSGNTQVVIGSRRSAIFVGAENDFLFDGGEILKPTSIIEHKIDLNELENSGTVTPADENAPSAKTLSSQRFEKNPAGVNAQEKPTRPVLIVTAEDGVANIIIGTKKHFEIEVFKDGQLLTTLTGAERHDIVEPIEAGKEVLFAARAKYAGQISPKSTKSVFIKNDIKILSDEEIKAFSPNLKFPRFSKFRSSKHQG